MLCARGFSSGAHLVTNQKLVSRLPSASLGYSLDCWQARTTVLSCQRCATSASSWRFDALEEGPERGGRVRRDGQLHLVDEAQQPWRQLSGRRSRLHPDGSGFGCQLEFQPATGTNRNRSSGPEISAAVKSESRLSPGNQGRKHFGRINNLVDWNLSQ